jgi:inorganic triphosphatase YgiF
VTAEASTHGPTRSVEIEQKFDVDDAVTVPDWTTVPGVDAVGSAEPRRLDAVYLDTDDRALARAGYALRRRTGGPDEGWHVKGPVVDGGRVELGWPLGGGGLDVPSAVRAEIAHVTDAPLAPLARIENDRDAYALLDAHGAVVAEFVDDHVRTTDVRAGDVRAWREWEIELGPAAPADHDAFFAAIAEVALAAGARPAASSSKLARALGH